MWKHFTNITGRILQQFLIAELLAEEESQYYRVQTALYDTAAKTNALIHQKRIELR